MTRHRISGCALLLLSSLALAAEATSVRSYPLPAHGTLELTVPSSWKESVSRPPGDLPPTIEFSPASGGDFDVQITPIWGPTADPDLGRPEAIRALVDEVGSRLLDQAVETEIILKEIKGPRAEGYVFMLTDRAPAEEEWKYMTVGAVGVEGLLLSFTILSNSPDSGERDQALRMIEQSRHAAAASSEPAPAPAAAPSTLRKLTYPGKSWSLVLDLPGFEFQERATRPDMTGIEATGENNSTGVLISANLEKAARAGDAKATRAYYWSRVKKTRPSPKKVVFSERGEMAILEYIEPGSDGKKAHIKHVTVFLSREDTWIVVSVSKVDYRPEDAPAFEVVLQSIRIDPGGSSRP